MWNNFNEEWGQVMSFGEKHGHLNAIFRSALLGGPTIIYNRSYFFESLQFLNDFLGTLKFSMGLKTIRTMSTALRMAVISKASPAMT